MKEPIMNTLQQDERVRTTREYNIARKYGQMAHGKYVSVTVTKRVGKGSEKTRLGVVVSVKVSKSSPRRHQLKRWTREIFRNIIKHELSGFDVVVVFKTDPKVDHSAVDADTLKTYRKALGRWQDSKNTKKKN
jgi:ribonuclease P protein component